MSQVSFSNSPSKIGTGIHVDVESKSLTKIQPGFRAAIADAPIVVPPFMGQKKFQVRIDNLGENAQMMIGFSSQATFDPNAEANFSSGLSGCALRLNDATLVHSNGNQTVLNDDKTLSKKASMVTVILDVNGKMKVIHFDVDGNLSKMHNVSADPLFSSNAELYPVIVFGEQGQKVSFF
jgi:hypothetical protein